MAVEKLNDPLDPESATGCVDCCVSPLWDAVMVEALSPKVMPFEFANVIALRLFDVVPADTLMLPPADGTDTTTEPFDTPTDAMPAPAKLMERASTVPLDDCVVFDTAYAPREPTPTDIVLPFVANDTTPVAESDEVAGADIAIWDPFVPESVTLIPDRFIVEPDAVVLPEVFPDRFIQLFSAAAPGAATEIARPFEFSVTDAFVADVPVPAYPRASRERPELFTVQVTFDCAVLSPIASFDARAVVKPLWLATIDPFEV